MQDPRKETVFLPQKSSKKLPLPFDLMVEQGDPGAQKS